MQLSVDKAIAPFNI